MPSWPDSLPKPAIDSLNESPPNNTIRSSMDKGPAKVRRRTTANVRPISFMLTLKPDQVDILDAFYDVETYSGVDAFDYIHPRTHQPCQARFTQPPQYADRQGILYTASVSLEILP